MAVKRLAVGSPGPGHGKSEEYALTTWDGGS